MRKKASVTIISLWVLVILTVLVVGIGHRVSLALRLSRYQKDRLQAFYLAKAGVNRAIVEILNDQDPTCDTLKDNWADNEKVFKEIAFAGDEDASATVSYTTKDGAGEITVFGVSDEEGKININTAPHGLLAELLYKIGVNSPAEIAANICAWRGDTDAAVVDYQDLGYVNKADKILRVEELILVKGISIDILNSLKGLITVYGLGRVNINTASFEILEILGNYCAKEGAGINFPTDLATKITSLRQEGKIFTSLADLKNQLTEEQSNIINNLVDTKSTCFYIVSDGRINKDNMQHFIRAVFNRTTTKIVYWYEN